MQWYIKKFLSSIIIVDKNYLDLIIILTYL